MKRIKYSFFAIIVLALCSCARPVSIPATPATKTPCDDIIQQLIDSLQRKPSARPQLFEIEDSGAAPEDLPIAEVRIDSTEDCSFYKSQSLLFAQKYNQALKESKWTPRFGRTGRSIVLQNQV